MENADKIKPIKFGGVVDKSNAKRSFANNLSAFPKNSDYYVKPKSDVKPVIIKPVIPNDD